MKKQLEENQTKDLLSKIGIVVVASIIGGIIGLGSAILMDKSGYNVYSLVQFVLYFILFIAAFMLQIILHELGHLIFGLYSGYRFTSFRIGTLTFIKEDEKIVLKKFNIPGTAGQCLMMPPDGNSCDCPYVLYNLGGIVMNTLVSCLCLVIYTLLPMPEIIRAFLYFVAISGLYDLIMNGVPMKIGGISNDGYNIISIKKDKVVRNSYYTQLMVNGLLYQGVRMKDIPFKYFEIPQGANLNNPMIGVIKCFEGSYYHDRKEFDKAKECFENLLNDAPKLIGLLKNEIKCELLFYEVIGECRKEVIDELYTKKLKKYIKATNCFIGRKRLMYAYALIIEKDKAKADKILKEMDKVQKTYPVKSEIESELEIIEFINEKYVLGLEN
ncbi:M50 family metallopeptidase [Hathewaya histolytica]|uniref:M50 family metallopeptidase n=1 Tax=Hathewaya histolytica TaxID=1498 RepID=UPI003B670E5F